MNHSFSYNVKEEIIRKEFNTCCKKSLLAGVIKHNFKIVSKKINISLSSSPLIRRIFKFLKELYPDVELEFTVSNSGKYKRFILIIGQGWADILKDLEIYNSKLFLLNFSSKKNNHCKRAYLAGVFISIGSLSSPETSNYHLELQFKDDNFADLFLSLVSYFGFEFKKMNRNKKIVCYIKKSNVISDFLKLIDASNSVLLFENQRIERDFINNINRLNNIDIYNHQKTIFAADNQIKYIKYLVNINCLNELEDKIFLLASLRLKHPFSSLLELSRLMDSLYNIKVSKSGINHWFRRIKQLYTEKNKNK